MGAEIDEGLKKRLEEAGELVRAGFEFIYRIISFFRRGDE